MHDHDPVDGSPMPPSAARPTIVSLVAQATARWPARTAVSDGDGTAVSYAELWERAGTLALDLRDGHPRESTRVAVLMTRTVDAVTALLAILRAGDAYVPVEASWPFSRARAVLEEASVSRIVCDPTNFELASRLAAQTPALDIHCVGTVAPDCYDEQLDAVRAVFDFVADQPNPLQAAGFNLRDTEDFADAHVTAYVQHVLSLVRAHTSMNSVIEVGVGTGVVAQALAPHVQRFHGTDLSPTSLDVARAALGLRAPFSVTPAHRTADLGENFECALLASVTQFFPTLGYLYLTLESISRVLHDRGTIVIADVEPSPGDTGHTWFPPEVFRAIQQYVPRLEFVAIHDREDRLDLPPQLRRRYDVVLRRTEHEQAGESSAHVRSLGWHSLHQSRADASLPTVDPDDDAYVIFTSGSTGTPKGVQVAHAPIVDLLDWMFHQNPQLAAAKILLTTSFSFDLSVFDIFGTLSRGGHIRIANEDDLLDPPTLLAILGDEQISVWDSTPAALEMCLPFIDVAVDRALEGIKTVMLSGDWISHELARMCEGVFPNARLIALGGATECTVWSNSWDMRRQLRGEWRSVPYGRSMPNVEYRVLDERLLECDTDVPGDLYISGRCLARGYVNRAGLTASRFVADPASLSGGRMYHTGDRARWRDGQVLEFLGRSDSQVKLRGFRVELGDVRAALQSCPGVVRAHVEVVGTGLHAKLVAAFTSETESDPDSIRRHLNGLLPRYMLPQEVVQLDVMPVNTNGKIPADFLAVRQRRTGAGPRRAR